MSTGPSVSTAASSEDEKKEHRLVDVMFLCDEWKSSKGGLSTFNREFAINLAETTTGSMKIHCYVSKSDDRDREDAKQHGVNLVTARSVPGSSDPFECLKFPPSELPNPQLVIGHGRKLGSPAYSLMQYTKCKWIQFVHVYCEDLGKYKKTTAVATDTIEENEKKHKMEIDLCKVADAVVAVGSRLQQKYSRSLPNVKVEIITPGIFEKFSSESQFALHRSDVKNFNVFLFGRATFEDLSLKGYDIVANAIGSLGKRFELKFVGSSPGEHKKVEQWFLDNTRINRNQLTIRGYCSDPEELRTMFYQSDLVALPSRTEGFGLVALEAVSAGIPILVSGESGIAEALREVKGGKTVIVELDEDTDEWARRISKMAKESAEEREAKARRLRKNYRKVYSWRVECEKFKGMIAKVMENANDDEIDVGVEVEDLKPAKSKNQTTTSSMESAECQMDELLKSSAESTMVGSVSHPGTESLPEIREKFFYLVGKRYLQTMKPQSKKEYDEFIDYLQKLGAIMTRVRRGSLVITVKCESLQILEDLWKDYSSGHLGEVVQNCFVTEKILKELNLAELRLKTTIDTEDYNACKVYFEKVAHRDALSAQPYFISTADEAQLERRKQNTEVVESEKLKGSLPILEMSTTGHDKEGEEPQETMKEQEELLDLKLQRMKGIPPLTAIPTTGHEEELEEPTEKIGNWEEPEDPPVKFRRMEGFSPFHEMSTIGQEKGGEELEETLKATWPLLGPSTSDLKEELEELRLKPQGMEDQKLNIKVDVDHVKLADHDTCSTASVSTMEPAECQKVSIASGARRKRPSDTDLEDVQPLEKKVLCLIAMNYLHTTPPESRDECNEFQEYLLDMKVHITCVSVGSLVITVKCNSLKSLEELWEDYSCGLLGKMVRDCFVTEKILKELNLAELKLKTTMDIEEYNACKLYFEKNAPRGALSSVFHPISSTSKSSQKQEELKKWKQKTKIEKTEKMKGTPPLTVISTTGKRKELEESTGKTDALSAQSYIISTEDEAQIERWKQNTEVVESENVKSSSPILEMSTTGHNKEGEEPQETMKGILPLTVSSSSDSDDDSELEGRLKTFTLQEEKRILPPSEEELEELLMKLQSMKDTSPSTKLPTAGHGKELEGKLKTMTLQEKKRTWPVHEFSASDPEEDLAAEQRMKLQGMEVTSPSAAYRTTGHEKEKKGTSLSTKLSTVGHGKELEGKLKTMKLQEEKSILPLSEEEPEGLLMKLQRMKGQKKELERRQKTIKIQGEKGSLPSSPLSTTDLEEKLEEVFVKLMRLRKEGKLAVPESSTSHLVKKLAELCMELIRLRMEGTLPPPELFTAHLEEELKELDELVVNLYQQRYEDRHLIWTFHGDVRELLRQLQEKRTEGSLPSSPLSTTDLEEKLEEVCVELMRLRKEGSVPALDSSTSHLEEKLAELCTKLRRLRMEGTLPPPELFTANLEEELEELLAKLNRQRCEGSSSLPDNTFEIKLIQLLEKLKKKKMEVTMYPTIRSGLEKFDVSLPEELQSYVSYLFNESAKLGLRRRVLLSPSAVKDFLEAMDEHELKTFLTIHIREGAWQVVLLFTDEVPSDKLPRDWFDEMWDRHKGEETVISSLYSSTSGILKAWPTEYDPDLVTLCKAITNLDWKVTRLILSGSRISDEGLKNLSTALTQSELYSLALCANDLQSQGLKHLCEALISGNCDLISLSVTRNGLGEEGIMHLCDVLTSNNCKLNSLNVSQNFFGNEGIKLLCDALISANCTLTSLKASWNVLGDEGIMPLARALTNKNCALTSLDISFNRIGDEGTKFLCKALTDTNCKLRSLNLHGNLKVTDVGKQCLSEAITGTDWEVREGLILSLSIKSEAQ